MKPTSKRAEGNLSLTISRILFSWDGNTIVSSEDLFSRFKRAARDYAQCRRKLKNTVSERTGRPFSPSYLNSMEHEILRHRVEIRAYKIAVRVLRAARDIGNGRMSARRMSDEDKAFEALMGQVKSLQRQKHELAKKANNNELSKIWDNVHQLQSEVGLLEKDLHSHAGTPRHERRAEVLRLIPGGRTEAGPPVTV